MTTNRLMLAPRPGSKSIARVLVIAHEAQGRAIVLDIDALHKNPALLKPYSAGYYHAILTWRVAAFLIFATGIALSLLWHWWAILIGGAIAGLLRLGNRQTVADITKQVLREHAEAAEAFRVQGLVWSIDPKNLVPT